VTDPETALTDSAPVIHEEYSDNLAFRWSAAGGDVEAVFAQADTILEFRVVNHRLIANAMEPRAVAAHYEADTDNLTLWSTTQVPHVLRNTLADVLGLPAANLRVIAPEVGGGFGAKAGVYSEEVVISFLARRLGRPVKWVATRGEDYLATGHGRDQLQMGRLAATREGRVLGIELKLIADCGAYYGRITPTIPTLTAQMITGVYDIPNVRVEILGAFTNKVQIEPYRGAGRPEAAFLIERVMDVLADRLGIDPAEIRRRNFIPPDRFPYHAPIAGVYDSGEYARALNKALELADYQELRAEQVRRRQAGGKLIGVGLACYVEMGGVGPFETGIVTIDPDGKATVLSGSSPHGQGHETSWAQIAAQILQVPLEDVTVKHGDTAVVPRGIGTFGSRSTPVGGSAIFINAQTVRERGLEIAAHLLEAAPLDMTLSDGRFHVRGLPERSLTWQDVAQAAYHNPDLPAELQGKLTGEEDFKPQGNTYPFGAHIAVVEIDPDTGEVELTRFLAVDDCGRVINPLLVEGQVHGGIAQGVGQALLEQAVYDETGNLSSGSLLDYALPRADNFPVFETDRTETPAPQNPLGAKGIGEGGTTGSTPAIANAVMDALSPLGIEHLDMPFTAEKVWRAIQAHRS
jgi:carbon-monoxide dehydrogenase large subunit